MHIAFVNKYYFPPHLGGVEQSMNLLARSLVFSGERVSAIVANEAPSSVTETLDGVEVHRLARTFAFASTPIAPGMRGALRAVASGKGGADLFHLQFPYPWGELSWLSAATGTPTVMTYHADVVRQKRLMTAYAPILRRVLDGVDRIIVGAPQMIEHSPFLAPHAEKCRVVPFAIDLARFVRDAEVHERVARARESIEGPVVLFVGRLVYYKGVDVLLEAMRDVAATLVIVGRGPLEGELRERAVALGIAHRVVWLEPLDDADLAAWYEHADIFCLPSTARTEAYGLVQLEAHQAATPVVSTDLPTGVPFVNQHEVTGLVVPPGDATALAEALTRLAEDEPLRRRLGEQARARVHSEFSVEAMARRTMSVYQEAIDARKG
jgi:rhamnosyl/mannosyltransferase